MLNIIEATEDARYAYVLEEILNELGGKEILRLSYGPEEVDIDVLLENGRVFSYYYNEDDCKWWDSIELKHVREEMLDDSVGYVDIEHYQKHIAYELKRASLPPLEPLSYA